MNECVCLCVSHVQVYPAFCDPESQVEEDGWMGGWMDRWVDRWMDGCMDGCVDGWIDGWLGRRVGG